MVTGVGIRSATDAKEFTAEPPLTENIEMTGTEPLAQRPAVSKNRHSAMAPNTEVKRLGNAVKTLTDPIHLRKRKTTERNS